MYYNKIQLSQSLLNQGNIQIKLDQGGFKMLELSLNPF